jgi:hypothetical protein
MTDDLTHIPQETTQDEKDVEAAIKYFNEKVYPNYELSHDVEDLVIKSFEAGIKHGREEATLCSGCERILCECPFVSDENPE